MFAAGRYDVGDFLPHAAYLDPQLWRDAQQGVRLENACDGKLDNTFRRQTRQDGIRQLRPPVSHPQLPRLALGIASGGALRRKVIPAIDHGDVIELCETVAV